MHVSLTRAFGLLFFTLCWLSYDHYRPWVNFHGEAAALFGIGLLALSRCLQGEDFVLTPNITVVVLILAVLPWIQYATGINPFAGDALLASLYLCGLAAAIWLGHSYSAFPDGTASVSGIFSCIWIAALASAAIALLQWLNLQETIGMYVVQTDVGDRAMGNFGQPNQLATFLLMGVCATAWAHDQKQIGRAGFYVATLFLLLGITFSQSRSGTISAFLVLSFLAWKNVKKTERLHPGLFILLAVLFFGMYKLLPLVHELLYMDATATVGKSLTSDSARITIWSQVLAGVSAAPWAGYGWNGTPTAHAVGSLVYPGFMTYTNAHNVILDLLVWTGIPIGLAITSLFIYWFSSRIIKVSGPGPVYAFAALIPVAIHSLVEYPFAYAYFLMAAGLMVGIVESEMKRPVFRLPHKLGSAVVGLGLLCGGYLCAEYLLVEEDFRVVRFENLKIGQTPPAYDVPKVYLLSQLGSMLDVSRLRARPGMSARDIENLRRVSRRFAYGSLHLRYALSLGLNGNPEEAAVQFATIHGMYGEAYYRAAVFVLRDEQKQYPQLAKVITP